MFRLWTDSINASVNHAVINVAPRIEPGAGQPAQVIVAKIPTVTYLRVTNVTRHISIPKSISSTEYNGRANRGSQLRNKFLICNVRARNHDTSPTSASEFVNIHVLEELNRQRMLDREARKRA